MSVYPPVAGVLFDMDGTLVDSDAAVERSWRTWARRWGVDPVTVLAVMTGHPAEDTVRREYVDLDGVVAAPGALDALDAVAAAGLPWAVVTSADARLAALRLGAAGITAPLVVDRGMVARGKPDPEGYLLAARRLGVAPADCLVVEDSATGAASGRAAGARVAGLKGIDADVVLASLHDLAGLLGTPETTLEATAP